MRLWQGVREWLSDVCIHSFVCFSFFFGDCCVCIHSESLSLYIYACVAIHGRRIENEGTSFTNSPRFLNLLLL